MKYEQLRFFRYRLKHVFFHSKSARSSDSAPPAVNLHMLEVNESELITQNIQVDNFGLYPFTFTIETAKNLVS